MGGTGILADGGIGGTGIRADAELGLMGVVTGFGSICVNGVEVHYDAGTPVTLNGEPASSGALAIGQVVAVNAFGNSAEARARAIGILNAAVGPVTSIDTLASTVHVSGQRVRVEPDTVFGAGLTTEALAKAPGSSVRVSGLRSADGSIVATRIEPASPDARALAAGPVAPDLGTGRFIVQGYLAGVDAGRDLRIEGMVFRGSAELAAQARPDRLVRLSGRVEPDGRRLVERAQFLSAPRAPRRDGGARSMQREREDRSGGESGRSERETDRPERSGPSDRNERPDRSGSSERVERPERVDRSGSDRSERPERIDRSGRR